MSTRYETDALEHAGHVQAMLTEYRVNVDADVWDTAAIDRARRLGRGPTDVSESGAWIGPWHTVRPYVTTEFRQWMEEHFLERVTLAEWRRRAIAGRDAENTRQLDYMDSAAFPLDELERLRVMLESRDELIVSARERGATWGAIGASSGLSRAQLHNIATRHAARLAAADELAATAAVTYYDDDEPF